MTTPRKHGCFNRREFRAFTPMQDGWYMDGTTRVPKMISVPFRAEPGCQYTRSDLGTVDAGCDGCRWQRPAAPPL